jgi:digeranylgeranylglycerophospholipid reductase
MYVLDVTGTYQHFASQAEHAGADVRTGHQAIRFRHTRSGGVATVKTDEREIDLAYDVLVDASGYRAMASKGVGLHPGFTRFGVGAEIELIAPQCDMSEAVLIVGSRYAPSGYGWVFPWGDGRVRVGVGVHHADVRSDPRAHL